MPYVIRRIALSLAALAVLAWAAFPLAARPDGKPDFSGEWKMNAGKSDFGPLPAPLSRTDKIEHKEPKLKISRTQANEQGETTSEINCTTDGKECSVEIRGAPLKLKTTVQWDGDALAFDSKGTFGDVDVRIKEKWSLSQDAKTITVKRHLESPQGEADQTIILEKQS